jgi:NAD(P)-dependent dehydrogenase (short-subunit alcohol dehydrogenase family)
MATAQATVSAPILPVWRIEPQDYDAVCAYLGLTPKPHLYAHLTEYLAGVPNQRARPRGFARYLATGRLTGWRIARLDLASKLFLPDHPIRHVLNAVIAIHECDGEAYHEMASGPSGWKTLPGMLGWGLGFALDLAISIPWLGWQLVRYAPRAASRNTDDLAGRRVLISGVGRGLGKDLLRHCLERGAAVVGIVRSRESREALEADLPVGAPVTLVVADLSKPGAAIAALEQAQIEAGSIAMAILCAGVKHDGESVLSLPDLRDTFQVNFFSAAELAGWVCGRGSTTAIVLISSMGRWHGMHSSCGYNASKAALSIWGESLDMELRRGEDRRCSVTVVEPGMFASGMTRTTPLTRLLFASRREVASRIVAGALAGRRVIRPPLWFALLTWGICLMGRNFRYRLLARAKPGAERR